jgi:dihydrofolate reductase
MNCSQKPKISVYIAISIDGYIARTDHGLDWLEKFNSPQDNPTEDYGFKYFLKHVDTLIIGKNTYQIAARAPIWPYEGKRVIVLSSSLSSVCVDAEIYSGDIQQLISTLNSEGVKHIYVDGGKTISQFLNLALIDELTLSIIPVILGSGIPLFNHILQESWCRLVSSQSYSNGLLQLKYGLIRSIP